MLHPNFEVMSFPAGEVHVKATCPPGLIYFPLKEDLNRNLMQILLATDVYKRNYIASSPTLYLPYLPYSRQDRITSQVEPFSLKVLGDILNLQDYYRVITLDVHSDVAFACIKNLHNIPFTEIFHGIFKSSGEFEKTLVIPDQGAYKRLKNLIPSFKDSVIAVKDRDVETGYLDIKGIVGDVYSKDCLIADDICDGGMTFILLAEKLYDMGAKSVTLAVTHGIFSRGLEPLYKAGINKIYTTSSFPQVFEKGGELIVIDVEEILSGNL